MIARDKKQPSPQLSEHDRLVTRPDKPLPTPLDPAGPQTRAHRPAAKVAPDSKAVPRPRG